MKVTILNEGKSEPIMELSLEQMGNGVKLHGKDANGNKWSILEISEKGIYLFPGISEYSGWPLDSEGRLKLKK